MKPSHSSLKQYIQFLVYFSSQCVQTLTVTLHQCNPTPLNKRFYFLVVVTHFCGLFQWKSRDLFPSTTHAKVWSSSFPNKGTYKYTSPLSLSRNKRSFQKLHKLYRNSHNILRLSYPQVLQKLNGDLKKYNSTASTHTYFNCTSHENYFPLRKC